jgi:hypothetical protein
LWIDCLCIIQDDDDDWKLQAAQMAHIYEQAHFTIAATKAEDGSQGCFSLTDPEYISKAIPGWETISVRRHVHAFPYEYYEFTGGSTGSAPLFDRGWTYQEQLLSPRLIHFCDSEVVWQCKRGIRGGGGFTSRTTTRACGTIPVSIESHYLHDKHISGIIPESCT